MFFALNCNDDIMIKDIQPSLGPAYFTAGLNFEIKLLEIFTTAFA